MRRASSKIFSLLALLSLLVFLAPYSPAEEGTADQLVDRLLSAPTEKEWKSLLPEFKNQGAITASLLFKRLQAYVKTVGSLNSPGGEDLSRRVLSALIAMGPTGQRVSASRLRDREEHPEIRVFAGKVLIQAHGQQAIPALLEVLSQNFSPSQSAFLSSLILLVAELRDKRSLGFFINALGHPAPSVRWSSATALGLLGEKDAIAPLIKALRDEDPAVQTAVDRALRKITGKDAGFFPLADPESREKALRRWEQWWAEGGKGNLLPPPTFKEVQPLLEALLLWLTQRAPSEEIGGGSFSTSHRSSKGILYVVEDLLPKGCLLSVPGFKVILMPRSLLSEKARREKVGYCDFEEIRVGLVYAEVICLWKTPYRLERKKFFFKRDRSGHWVVLNVLSSEKVYLGGGEWNPKSERSY